MLELVMMERYLCKELGYSFYDIMDHPHKYILYYIKVYIQHSFIV